MGQTHEEDERAQWHQAPGHGHDGGADEGDGNGGGGDPAEENEPVEQQPQPRRDEDGSASGQCGGEVLAEMAQGKSNAAIANALGISESAVEKHISTLLAKLGLDPDDATVNRRVAAVLAFFRSGGPTAGRSPTP